MKSYLIAIIACFLAVAGCTTPSETFTARAERVGLTSDSVRGEMFQHRVYWNAGARRLIATADEAGRSTPDGAPRRRLHVYLGGDGVPWRGGHPTSDPTSRNPLMLRLIAIDRTPSVFLGRPCFHGYSKSEPCDWRYWNDARYSEPVVASMASALEKVRARTGADEMVLFGASGGGALAVLISDRVNAVEGIVTVAANLDTRAWLSYYAYDGLRESLNPAQDGRKDKARNAAMFERHYAGGKDVVVPPETMKAGLRSPDELIVIAEYDHNCCWYEIWPQILATIARIDNQVPAASSEADIQPGS